VVVIVRVRILFDDSCAELLMGRAHRPAIPHADLETGSAEVIGSGLTNKTRCAGNGRLDIQRGAVNRLVTTKPIELRYISCCLSL
jgi:hypothetical protein